MTSAAGLFADLPDDGDDSIWDGSDDSAWDGGVDDWDPGMDDWDTEPEG